MTPSGRCLRLALKLAVLLLSITSARGEDLPEYRLKAAFLYNFVVFTEWPADVGAQLNLCVVGQDPFGADLDALNSKTVGHRSIVVQRLVGRPSISGCQVLFIARSAIGGLSQLLAGAGNNPVLTVADSPNAANDGVAINMAVQDAKVFFQVNLKAVRGARLNLSSKLLRLAREIHE